VRFPQTRSGRVWRGLIGCVTAYVIALQLALSGLAAISSLVSSSLAQAAENCADHVSAGDDASGQPSGHHTTCPCGAACAMSGCAAALDTAVAAIAWRVDAGSSLVPRLNPAPVPAKAMAKGPHNPRAPPRADVLAA
jgi:hypothetical protein